MDSKKDKKRKKGQKTKKRERSLRREVAKRAYLDPRSNTFLKKGKSALKAGYSEATAKHDASKILDNSNFTNKDLAKIETFLAQDPQIDALLDTKLQQLRDSGDISAKDYSNLIRHKQLVLDAQSILKTYIEQRSVQVNVTLPPMVCEKCGHVTDIMKRDYEGEGSIDA